jgi:hypothetical protein
MPPPVKPNLVVIGAMKASTTLLYEMLGRHPKVWFPSEKEPHYFTHPDYGTAPALRQYLELFALCPEGMAVVGDASTGYSKLPHLGSTPARIRETLGQPKMIYILRDPVQRTVSNFRHVFARGAYRPGYRISDAVVEDPIIVDASLYERQLLAYEAEFGPGSVLVLIADELHRHPARTLREVERYLGIEAFDGWDQPFGSANSEAVFRETLRLRGLVGTSTFVRRAGRIAPRWVRSAVQRLAPPPPLPTPVTPADEDIIFRLVADDLRRLQSRLGERIDCWPSVRRLGAATTAPPLAA